MTRKQRRGVFIGGGMAILGIAVALILYNLRGSMVFYYDPTEFVEKNIQPGIRIKLGGLVAEGSLKRGPGNQAEFDITDGKTTKRAKYTGNLPLPDLFREKRGTIAEGQMSADGVFITDRVLAKHDENYMPREVAESLKKQGVWQGDGKGAAAAPKGASQ